MTDSLKAALELSQLGWNVLPAKRGGKSPIGKWQQYQEERIGKQHLEEFFGETERNLFVVTGRVSGLIVVDCDDAASLEFWQEKLPAEAFEGTARAETGKGSHLYFRLPDGVELRSKSSSDESCRWDIRSEGGGVIAPPSVHSTGRVYAWAPGRGPEKLREAPGELLDYMDVAKGPNGNSSPRSVLSQLLATPPTEGGRNVWLAKVAGHHAHNQDYEDTYEIYVRRDAATIVPPLSDKEVEKTMTSIWQAEQAKQGKEAAPLKEDGADRWRAQLVQPTDANGWLVSTGQAILVQTKEKRGETYEIVLAQWMDADIRVLGIIQESDIQGRSYEVQLINKDGEQRVRQLSASTIADVRKLSVWLANCGAGIGPPDGMWPRNMRATERMRRYLESQGAPELRAVDALGWDFESEGFITHEGVIRSTGFCEFEEARPTPGAKAWAPYRYGFCGEEKAKETLREVLTFHDEEVAGVFGAWWAAALLKPQIEQRTSQFPFMALEAASESGKTKGFFALMLQLSGLELGNISPTRAAMRDYLSATKSGVVWMDDLDSLEAYGELLRNATVGGTLVKKAQDYTQQTTAKLSAALVVAGESLGLSNQKALVDRSVALNVPSPVDRKSHRQAEGRLQWADIVDLMSAWEDNGGLSAAAGNIVQMALEAEKKGMLDELAELQVGSGRSAEKMAVLRVGARMLAEMTGDQRWIDIVDSWVTPNRQKGASDKENKLTLTILPQALSRWGMPTEPAGPEMGRWHMPTPAFVDAEGIVWFSPLQLATWWADRRTSKKVDSRVDSEDALRQQAAALGLQGHKGDKIKKKQFRLAGTENQRVSYLSAQEYSQVVIHRAEEKDIKENDNDGGDSGGH